VTNDQLLDMDRIDGEGYLKPPTPPSVCECGTAIVWARIFRTNTTLPIALDENGQPQRVRRGEYTALACGADCLGREPLVVVTVPDHRGRHVDHRLTCHSTNGGTG